MIRIAHLFAGVVLALSAIAAVAQHGPVLKADVPFDFVMGGHRMPAGTYRIQSAAEHVLLIWNDDGQTGSYIAVQSTESAPANGRLVFHRYGSRLYLKQVWAPGSGVGSECIPGRAEKEASQSTARVLSPIEVALVELARR